MLQVSHSHQVSDDKQFTTCAHTVFGIAAKTLIKYLFTVLRVLVSAFTNRFF